MATLSISVPDAIKDWVDAQAESGRYGSASDYVRDLISRDKERAGGLAELQMLISEGFASGISDRSMDDLLEMARARVRAARTP